MIIERPFATDPVVGNEGGAHGAEKVNDERVEKRLRYLRNMDRRMIPAEQDSVNQAIGFKINSMHIKQLGTSYSDQQWHHSDRLEPSFSLNLSWKNISITLFLVP